MISQPELAEFDHPASIIYYKDGDLQAAYQALVSQGVKCEDEPHLIAQMEDHDLWMLFLRDPDDNLLCLMSEVRDRPAAG
jgi:methylmalonyl-CoA/ethylmalonyl-CoA epimerase